MQKTSLHPYLSNRYKGVQSQNSYDILGQHLCYQFSIISRTTENANRPYSVESIQAHIKVQTRESHVQLSNLQCCHFDIVILRVAIISNVQNVRLQRRHRPTDNYSTRRWRGSQQTCPANNNTFITSLVTFSLSIK